MWLKFSSILIFCYLVVCISANVIEYDSDNSKNYLDSLTEWFFGNDEPASYDKIKKMKQEILKKNKEILKKELSDKDYDPDEYDEDDYDLIKKKMKKIENSKSSDEKKKLIDELIQKLKSKYQSKLNKLLLQESMLCKINDQADDFDSLNNVRPKLRYGDIIEFKRLGYSHFSIYIDNNQLLQFENPLYNNITFKNVFNDFPSLTIINKIDLTSHGDPVLNYGNKF